MEKLLKVKDLTLKLPSGRVLFEHLNFDVSAGELLLIKGPNGCGKSTLLRTLIKGRRTSVKRFYRHAEYLPQTETSQLPYPITLGEILKDSSTRHHEYEQFGLLDSAHLHLNWNTCSGGEKKRLLLTKALLHSPDILFLDEPFNHLDNRSIEIIASNLTTLLIEKRLKTLVLVSHQGGEHFSKKLSIQEVTLG